jgi:type II secretory pathway pseudopilin PulG
MRLRAKGFSLIEIVFVLALTSAILYAVALLTQRTLGSLNFLQKKSESIQSATLGCERLTSEMREAITQPSQGNSTSFVKVRPSAPPALGIAPPPPAPPVPAPPPAGAPVDAHLWPRTYPGGVRLTIQYAVNGENLERSVTGDPTTVVATSLNDFQVSKVAGTDRSFRVDLSVVEQKRVAIFTSYVFCPGVPP